MVQAKNSLLFCLTKTNYALQLFLALNDIQNKRNRILFFGKCELSSTMRNNAYTRTN